MVDICQVAKGQGKHSPLLQNKYSPLSKKINGSVRKGVPVREHRFRVDHCKLASLRIKGLWAVCGYTRLGP